MRGWHEDLDLLFAFEGPPPDDGEPGEPKPRAHSGSRRRRRRQSQRALAARRANLRKARAAPREVIYRSTEKRQAASLANLKKAQAARRTRRGNARARLNALKHGLYAAASLRESLGRLGESRREFSAHRRRLERLFAPEDEEETQIVRRLADACWRRLRFFRAAAVWEADRLKQILARAPRRPRLDPLETEDRAQALVLALSYSYDIMERESQKLNARIETHLRKLLRKRSEGSVEFRVFSPRRDPGSRTRARSNSGDDAGSFPRDDVTGGPEAEFKKLVAEFRSLPLEDQVELLSLFPKDE
jgi:hypothetical protein